MKKHLRTLSVLISLGYLLNATSCSTDKCAETNCQNYGTCVEGKCECGDGYEGDNCETRANTRFEGAYSGAENCDDDVDGVAISALGVSPRAITIEYTGLTEEHASLEATVSGNTITIAAQSVYLSGYEEIYSGSGTLNGNNLTLNISVDDNGNTQQCTFVGSR